MDLKEDIIICYKISEMLVHHREEIMMEPSSLLSGSQEAERQHTEWVLAMQQLLRKSSPMIYFLH